LKAKALGNCVLTDASNLFAFEKPSGRKTPPRRAEKPVWRPRLKKLRGSLDKVSGLR
jgi:hypothetical protein